MQEVRGMAKIKRKLHIQFRSIRNRMIFSFLLVFLAVLVFMGASIYLFTVNMLETRNQQSYEKILESAENVLDDRFSIYEGTARSILDDQTVQETLQEEDNTSGEFMSQTRLNALAPVGRELIYSMEDVTAVYLFDNSGKFYYEDPGRSTSDAEAAVKQVLDTYGRLDILVNCAGITRDTLLMRMTEQDWDLVIDVNLKGTFNFTKAAIKPMMKARYGKIVNISSVVGRAGNAGQVNYSASKAGVIGVTKSTAKELGSRNITVNAVAPGYIQTDMTEKLPEEAKNAFLQFIPLKRAGKPEDVANAVYFLCSPDSDYISGQVINVCGGFLM